MMRTLLSVTLFALTFVLVGDSRAPEAPPSDPGALAAYLVSGPVAEIRPESATILVVVLLPAGGGAWSIERALHRSVQLALEPGPERHERPAPWWSLERAVATRLAGLGLGRPPGEAVPRSSKVGGGETDPAWGTAGSAPIEGPL